MLNVRNILSHLRSKKISKWNFLAEINTKLEAKDITNIILKIKGTLRLFNHWDIATNDYFFYFMYKGKEFMLYQDIGQMSEYWIFYDKHDFDTKSIDIFLEMLTNLIE